MKTKIFFITVLFSLFVVANAQNVSMDSTLMVKIEKTFKSYVQTDFPAVEDFIEITSIEKVEDFSKSLMLDMSSRLRKILDDENLMVLKFYEKDIINDTTELATYLLKVRMFDQGVRKVNKFYCISINGKMQIQKTKLKEEQLPKSYRSFLYFVEQL